MKSIDELITAAVALGATTVGTITAAESDLIKRAGSMSKSQVEALRQSIHDGLDPLGDAYCTIYSPEDRRPLGQTYTPQLIINSMVKWAAERQKPERIVDPGAGSGRYLLAAAKAFPDATLHGADIDPLATLMLRANLAAAGLGERSNVYLGDYREMRLPKIGGRTLFIGNPPYVRHHLIDPKWKKWLTTTAKSRGFKASALAGLHVHFFLATAEHGRDGDLGTFITSAEWMDVNYGQLVRQLLLDDLGGHSLHVLDPSTSPFADAMTTGAITCFEIGHRPDKMDVRRVESISDLGNLTGGRSVSRQRLAEASRWSVLTRVTPKLPEGYIELGELCRVHRGAVTGANKVWVQQSQNPDLPEELQIPTITRARELFAAGERLTENAELKRVLDLPIDLDILDADQREQVNLFLKKAEAAGVPDGYVASARRAWWSVGLKAPAPILATYMARRPPTFVRNDANARHINIAHGLYPRDEISSDVLDRLANHLRTRVTLADGRAYAGGLVKFEPKEMERIPVPSPEMLLG